jgi:hypothetical protein
LVGEESDAYYQQDATNHQVAIDFKEAFHFLNVEQNLGVYLYEIRFVIFY